METTIQAVNFVADQKLLDYVKKKTEKLTAFFDRIITTEVYLKLDNGNSHIKDKVVELKVMLPGNTLFCKAKTKAFETALDETVESMKRQLKKHKEKFQE